MCPIIMLSWIRATASEKNAPPTSTLRSTTVSAATVRKLWQARREGGVEGKLHRAPRRLGAPPSLRNLMYTRMHHFEKNNSKIFFPRGSRKYFLRLSCGSRQSVPYHAIEMWQIKRRNIHRKKHTTMDNNRLRLLNIIYLLRCS